MVTDEKIGNIQLIFGKLSTLSTKAGDMAWPNDVPSNGEKANNTVTNICSAPANQFWLTLN